MYVCMYIYVDWAKHGYTPVQKESHPHIVACPYVLHTPFEAFRESLLHLIFGIQATAAVVVVVGRRLGFLPLC